MLSLQKWPIESSHSQPRAGGTPASSHKGSSVLWAQGSVPAPLAGREQHFLIRPRPPCQGWTLRQAVAFHSPRPAAVQALNVALVVRPLLSCTASPHPLPFPAGACADEPDRQPGGLSHHGLLRSGLLKVAQGSRKSGRTLAGPALQFPSGACGPVSTGKLRAHCHGVRTPCMACKALPSESTFTASPLFAPRWPGSPNSSPLPRWLSQVAWTEQVE